jgi:hypothetical protein
MAEPADTDVKSTSPSAPIQSRGFFLGLYRLTVTTFSNVRPDFVG